MHAVQGILVAGIAAQQSDDCLQREALSRTGHQRLPQLFAVEIEFLTQVQYRRGHSIVGNRYEIVEELGLQATSYRTEVYHRFSDRGKPRPREFDRCRFTADEERELSLNRCGPATGYT